MLYPIAENRQKFCRRIDSKTPMLVAYPLPDKGLRYSIKAWEWTVYFDNGVWRCLRDDKLNNVLRFFLLNFNRQIRGHRRHKNIFIMKKIKSLLLSLCLLGATTSFAQDTEIKYQGEVDLGYSFGVGTFSLDRVNLHTVHGAKINQYFSLGAGLGLDYYYSDGESEIMMPIYVNAKGYLPVNEKFSPYASLDLGYGIGVTTEYGGFYWSPAVGIKYNKFKFQIGYSNQRISESGIGFDMGAVQFKIGIAF